MLACAVREREREKERERERERERDARGREGVTSVRPAGEEKGDQ